MGGRRGRRTFAALLLAVAACALAPAAAGATTTFVWDGHGPFAWSEADNWLGGIAPSAADGTVDLEFPLSGCQQAPRQCGPAEADIPGLSVGTLTLHSVDVRFTPGPDPGPASYRITGTTPLKLAHGLDLDVSEEGAGENTASPGGTEIEPPLQLTGENSWRVGPLAEKLNIAGAITGPFGLQIALEGNSSLELPGEVETGPLQIAGGSFSTAFEGETADINGTDGEPVRLEDVTMNGAGLFGPLTLSDSRLNVGEAAGQGGEVRVNGELAFEAGSLLGLELPALERNAPYRVIASGRAQLGGAILELGSACPVLGATYVLLEAAGGVSGQFTEADGQPIANRATISAASGSCPGGAYTGRLRLEYLPDEVTVTAVGASAPAPGTTTTVPPGEDASAAAARAVLARDLGWLLAGRRIGEILAGRGEDVAMKAPRPGVFAVSWSVRRGGHRVLIATARLVLTQGGTGQLRIVLTRAARRVLRNARRLRVTVRESFTATGMPAEVTGGTLLLRR